MSNGKRSRYKKHTTLILVTSAMVLVVAVILISWRFSIREKIQNTRIVNEIATNINSAVWEYDLDVTGDVLRDYANWMRLTGFSLYENDGELIIAIENEDEISLQKKWGVFLPTVSVRSIVRYDDTAIATLHTNYVSNRYMVAFLASFFAIFLFLVIFSFTKLQNRRKDLQHTLRRLIKTQKQLVESSKQASLGHVIMGLTHEVNTPLGNALMAQSIIEQTTNNIDSGAPGEAVQSQPSIYQIQQSSAVLEANLKRIQALVLRFKQLEVIRANQKSGGRTIEALIEHEVDLFKAVHTNPAVHIHTNIPEELREIVVPDELSVAIRELLENSLKHCGDSEQTAIDISLNSGGTNSLTLKYSDNGPWIPETQRNNIFEPFVTSRRNDGYIGLGLYIVQGIASTLLNGWVDYYPLQNGGNQFVLVWRE